MRTFLEIPVGSERLAATLHLPEPSVAPASRWCGAWRASPPAPTAHHAKSAVVGAPVVICCHGLTGTRIGSCYRFVDLARRLEAENIACLRFDFRGCGESDGRFQDLSLPRLMEDVRAAAAVTAQLPGCDALRIGIVASSFGAFTTAYVAAEIDGLRCLVFWAPVAEVESLILREMNDAAWKALRRQGWIEHFGHRLGAAFFDQLPAEKAPVMLAKRPRPLLIYHAHGDEWVSIDHARAYEQALLAAGGEVRLEALDISDHAMRSVSANDTILNGTVAWLKRLLHPAPGATQK